jgi:UDP-2,3-diacylglucosamine pyrophosphatase LpxH
MAEAADRNKPRIAVVADSHLGGPGGDGDELIAQLRALPGQCIERLILLGDIFHVWVGSKRFETPEVRKLLPVLRELRAGGLRIDYVEGNRDFFLVGSPYADAFDSIVLETRFESAGQRVLAIHGDGLNQQDRQYRFWRWLSKSPVVRFFVLHLPGPVARRFVHSTENRLANTNFRHRKRVPEQAIRDFGQRRVTEGHDLVILGHFHEPHSYPLEGGEIRLLDAWFRSRRIEYF